MADAPDGMCADGAAGSDDECARRTPRTALDLPLSRKSWIDYEYTDAGANPKIVNGVKMGEGDGTVSLLSLGAMCVDGWQRKRYNPAGIKVVTVEVRVLFRTEISGCPIC
jgi:phospholipid:diacylglycerol acyltransferase